MNRSLKSTADFMQSQAALLQSLLDKTRRQEGAISDLQQRTESIENQLSSSIDQQTNDGMLLRDLQAQIQAHSDATAARHNLLAAEIATLMSSVNSSSANRQTSVPASDQPQPVQAPIRVSAPRVQRQSTYEDVQSEDNDSLQYSLPSTQYHTPGTHASNPLRSALHDSPDIDVDCQQSVSSDPPQFDVADFPHPPILVYRENNVNEALTRVLLHSHIPQPKAIPMITKAFDRCKLLSGHITVAVLYEIVTTAMVQFRQIARTTQHGRTPQYPSLMDICKDYPYIEQAMFNGFSSYLSMSLPQSHHHLVPDLAEMALIMAYSDNTMFFTILFHACTPSASLATVGRTIRTLRLREFPKMHESEHLPTYFRTIKDLLNSHIYLATYEVVPASVTWTQSYFYRLVTQYDATRLFPQVPRSQFRFPFQAAPSQYYYQLFTPFPYDATTLYPIWDQHRDDRIVSASEFNRLASNVAFAYSQLATARSEMLQFNGEFTAPPPTTLVVRHHRITWKGCTQGEYEEYLPFFKFFNKLTNATETPNYSSLKVESSRPSSPATVRPLQPLQSASARVDPTPQGQFTAKRMYASGYNAFAERNPATIHNFENSATGYLPREEYNKLSQAEKDARADQYRQQHGDDKPTASRSSYLPKEQYDKLSQAEKEARSAEYRQRTPGTSSSRSPDNIDTRPTRTLTFSDDTVDRKADAKQMRRSMPLPPPKYAESLTARQPLDRSANATDRPTSGPSQWKGYSGGPAQYEEPRQPTNFAAIQGNLQKLAADKQNRPISRALLAESLQRGRENEDDPAVARWFEEQLEALRLESPSDATDPAPTADVDDDYSDHLRGNDELNRLFDIDPPHEPAALLTSAEDDEDDALWPLA